MQLENTVSKILQNSCTVYIIYTLPLGTYRELEPPPPLMAREERKGGKLKNYQLQPTPPQPTPGEKNPVCATECSRYCTVYNEGHKHFC